ncbi:SLC13 family permease [Ochrobactrum sp. MC-1LL]|uniref:SLC13 family permease n=1 Tax=Ochrobactrum sp. MC-1LL TaxID=2735351 RepID=UPI0014385C47|nr:SLC13 family permease [Ochrobactrum sp. MC-1LL]NKE74444.1 hypothetical protein [Ochrobactrum sp. MC-1LL]
MYTSVIIFILVYLAMGLGKLPYFNVDRTGAALLGALALIVAGRISPEAAWAAIDYKTIWLLFGLMVISGAFTLSGFYDWTAFMVASLPLKPSMLLAVIIIMGAVLSSLLRRRLIN